MSSGHDAADIIKSMLIKSKHIIYRKLTNPQAKITVVTACMIVLLKLAGNSYVTASTDFANSSCSEEKSKFGIALPDEECRVCALSKWSQAEKEAWKNICESKSVDFNELLNENLDPTNPNHDDRWTDERRTLSANFLNTILLYEPFRSAIPYRGVQISAAYIQGELDLVDAVLERPLILEKSIFSSKVDLSDLVTPRLVSFNGSRFEGELDMDSISIGSSLYMAKSTGSENAVLIGAKIDGILDMFGSTFNGVLVMDDISVGSSLFMSGEASFETVSVVGARIDGSLDMSGSTFNGVLDMERISVGGLLSMGHDAQFYNTINLNGAKADGQLNMSGSIFNGELSMNGISVGKSLFMRDFALFNNIVDLRGAKIDGILDMSGSTFNCKLVMDGFSVGSSLIMSGEASFETVRVVGAKIDGSLNMSGSTFNGVLDMDRISVGGLLFMGRDDQFNDALFNNTVNLNGAKIDGSLDMTRSDFNGELSMNGISVGGSLIQSGALFNNTVDLMGANIDEQLNMINSIFYGELHMNGISVGEALFINLLSLSNNTVDLMEAKIDGSLDMSGSIFNGELSMNGISVGGSLLMQYGVLSSTFNLIGSKIDGSLEMSGAEIEGKVDMDSTLIGSNLILSDIEFNNTTNLTFLIVGSNLEIQGGVLKSLDLTGTRIEHILKISGPGVSILEWRNYELEDKTPQSSKLTLKNTKVDVLQDSYFSWPDHLELEGFTYNHRANSGLFGQEMPLQRDSEWFERWLEADKTYSPQPYRQLAGVLRTAGLEEMANDIQYASRDRMLRESSYGEPKFWILWALKLFIGYGIGVMNFIALAWMIGLVFLGVLILHISKELYKQPILQDCRFGAFFYSVDMIVPLIHLREQHYQAVDLITWARIYFYFHKLMGYILVIFVIAGLSGLTK